jgi:uncharacterized RDD family membrane protein YckC
MGRGVHADVIAVARPTGPVTAGREYAGLVTRTIAFAIDIAIIDVAALTAGGIVALGLSALELPSTVKTVFAAVGAALAVVWAIGYFAWFWSAAGQTPGDRVLGLQVLQAETGRPLPVGRAILRVGALVLSAIPFCAGFVMILFDDRRRALHDRLVGTEVMYRSDRAVRGSSRSDEVALRPGS